jgi:4-aminobutyrate aminotransferase-like enzyme
MRPPLVFSSEDANAFLGAFDEAVDELRAERRRG